jgi:hypothetical protein
LPPSRANGREWSCRQLGEEGIACRRADNCLPWIGDVARACALLDARARVAWPELLAPPATRFHPERQCIHELLPVDYCWPVAQTEYATGVMFRDRKGLEAIHPRLLRHAITSFVAADVLRFLGRRHAADGAVQSSRLTRVEGTRNVPDAFKVFRASERDPHGPRTWRTLRRSVVEMPRRAEAKRCIATRKGRTVITAFLAPAHADTEQHAKLAA